MSQGAAGGGKGLDQTARIPSCRMMNFVDLILAVYISGEIFSLPRPARVQCSCRQRGAHLLKSTLMLIIDDDG